MLILTIIGTRPEAIKLAPVLQELRAKAGAAEVHVCVTGQHREMLDQMLQFFDIRPDSDLDLMKPAQTLTETMASVAVRVDALLQRMKPDWVLVQGDTTTAMASALAAFHRNIRIAHVEAGLRSHDLGNPFPEEMNRIIIDRVSDIHFAPTAISKSNLLSEGISKESIFITGNTIIDALGNVLRSSELPPAPAAPTPMGKKIILVTAHRRENHGTPLIMICDALIQLSKRTDLHIVFPVHRNPEVWQPVHNKLSARENITLLPPVDYPTLVRLMLDCHLILTDSGGIQEEASTLGMPVLVLRSVTDRPEAVDAGTARVIGTKYGNIVAEVTRLLDNQRIYQKMAMPRQLFGDGRASERIAQILLAGGVLPSQVMEWASVLHGSP